MPEKLSIGRQGGAVEPMREPLRSLARRALGPEAAGGAWADRVELSARGGALRADMKRLEALEAAVEGRRYSVPADVVSRKLIEEQLAESELWRRLGAG